MKAKITEAGFSSDYQFESGYWVVAIWKTTNPKIHAKAAGMTALSATLACALEMIKNHLGKDDPFQIQITDRCTIS